MSSPLPNPLPQTRIPMPRSSRYIKTSPSFLLNPPSSLPQQQGNEAFGSENFEKAIEFYSKAIELDPKVSVYYSNRSAAYFNLEDFERSLEDANEALVLDPKYLKAYNRKASALFEMDFLKVNYKEKKE